MGKYTFTYTKKDLIEFCMRRWWEMRRRRPVTLLAFLLLLFSYGYIVKRFPYEIFILIIMLIPLEIINLYTHYKKGHWLQECSIWIEDGLLKFCNAFSYQETSCCQINHIIESKRLLMLGVFQKKNQWVWCVVPTRIFSSAKEQYEFLQNLKKPSSAPVITDDESKDFIFSFFMDTDKWIQTETEAMSAFHDREKNNPRLLLNRFLYYIFLYIAGITFYI